MGYRLKADLNVCDGFANCVMNAPDLFRLDDDDKVVIVKEIVSEDERVHAEAAVRACPVYALTLEPE